MAKVAYTGPGATPSGMAGGIWYAEDARAIRLVEGFKEVFREINGGNSDVSLFANLAQFFKKMAWTSNGGWKVSKVVIQNAIMYAILVVQSFMFLIAYIKRLFYVIILAVMAPVVVVYDFFNKSIS